VEDTLRGLGVRIVAVSADRPSKLRETLLEHDLAYTLLSDSSAEGARAFRIAWRVGDEEVERLRGLGVDLEAASGQSHHILPVPSIFLVDPKGIIRFVYTNPDYRVRLATDRLLEEARAVFGS
jgi:peroxiredoxin